MGESVETAPFVAAPKSLAMPFKLRPSGWLLLLLLIWLYHAILFRLAVQWSTDHDFNHGFLVPAFALFIVWQDRKHLASIRPAPSWSGLPIVVFSLAMLTFGVLGVELFTSRSSLLVLVAGLIILFRGWPLFRAVLFPWAFCFLMIPLPAIILQRITFPLQLFASSVATWCIQAVGIPASRMGNLIELPNITLEVAAACSGIRSLVSLITLAIIYGYLMENRNWVRVALACAAVPIAIAANVFRIFATGFLAEHWDPDKAMGFFHEFQGWLVFVVSLLLLYGLHSLINLIWKPSPTAAPAMPVADASHTPAQAAPTSPIRFAIVALLMLGVGVGLYAWGDEVMPPRQPLSSLPIQFDRWNGTDIPLDDDTLKVLGRGEFLQRDYDTDNPQEPEVELFVAYYPTQKFGDSIHAPLHCLLGAGFTPMRREVVQLDGPHGAFAANRWVAVKGLERSLVLYWYQAHGREVTSEYWEKYYLISDSIHLHRSDGTLIRLSTPMNKDESADAAQARLMKLGSQFLPYLDASIPR
jgi:exosortase D (VPLPA-CTERM-specific)